MNSIKFNFISPVIRQRYNNLLQSHYNSPPTLAATPQSIQYLHNVSTINNAPSRNQGASKPSNRNPTLIHSDRKIAKQISPRPVINQ